MNMRTLSTRQWPRTMAKDHTGYNIIVMNVVINSKKVEAVVLLCLFMLPCRDMSFNEH